MGEIKINHYITAIPYNYLSNKNFIQSITKNFLLISILSPEYNNFEMINTEYCIDILSLRFHDIVNNEIRTLYVGNNKCEIKKISNSDVISIITFINKYKDTYNEWLIHCEAGMSRSTAVALAISQILNGYNNYDTFIQSVYGLQHHNVEIKNKILDGWNEYNKKIL